jgi:hypothetical protein
VHDDVRLLAGKLARRGISQRVAKVGTAASCRRRPTLARHGIERVALQAVEVGGDLARIRGAGRGQQHAVARALEQLHTKKAFQR